MSTETETALQDRLAEVMYRHRDCGMWMPVERRRWKFPCGVVIDVPEDLDHPGFGLVDIERRHLTTAMLTELRPLVEIREKVLALCDNADYGDYDGHMGFVRTDDLRALVGEENTDE